MKITIHENKYYIIQIDKEENYMVLKPIGFWRSPDVVPNYLKHIREVMTLKLSLKFAVILDIADMLTHPKDVQEQIHLEGMKQAFKLNPSIILVVLPKDDISIMQAKFMARTLGREIKGYNTMEEAENQLMKLKREQKNKNED
jgi:hypothetical protein